MSIPPAPASRSGGRRRRTDCARGDADGRRQIGRQVATPQYLHGDIILVQKMASRANPATTSFDGRRQAAALLHVPYSQRTSQAQENA